jgi:UPF0755 protein
MSRKSLIIGLILIATFFVAGVIWYQNALGFRSKNNSQELLTISSGEKTDSILSKLKEKKFIISPLAVKIYLYKHPAVKIQAGEYQFNSNTSTRQLISDLSTGKSLSREVTVLFREGLTAKEMQALLMASGYIKDDTFLNLAKTQIKNLPPSLASFSFLRELPQNATLEGYLFPDTYRVYKNFTAEDLIKKMLENFEIKITAELRQEIKSKGFTLHQIVTMASLLEKEVRTEGDMKIVSGLFWDRINVGQALQSCASLAYILGVNKVQYTYEDTQIVSPYNTYQHQGLPPGPISNPGLRSIKAALNPIKTDYNYFLSRPDNGETIFSKTLDEHNTAKAKYLK